MNEKDKDVIYHFRRRLATRLTNLGNLGVSPEDQEMLRHFAHDELARGMAPSNVLKSVTQLVRCTRWLGTTFTQATKRDIIDLIGKVEAETYTKHTKRTLKIYLKIFYRWLRGTEDYPDEVRWIKPGKAKNSITPGDLLTRKEVEAMVDAGFNLRDKALIAVFYESACRPQEIIPLRIKQVQFDEYGTLLSIDGKGGIQRTVRLLASTPLLSTWLETHPRKSDPEAPVFPSFQHRNLFHLLTYAAFKKIIRDIAKRAGIARRVYPYLFRHSRLTELARTGFNGYQFNLFAGWTLNSQQSSTYIHLLSKDVDDAILKLNGIVKGDTNKVEFKSVQCARCRQNNTPGTKLCLTCGFPQDIKAAIEVEHRNENLKDKIEVLTAELAKSPEVLDMLLDAFDVLKNGNRVPTKQA